MLAVRVSGQASRRLMYTIPRYCTLEGVAEISGALEGVTLMTLEACDMIQARTRNSVYEIFLLEPQSGRALVRGGSYNRREDIVSAVRNLDGVIGAHNWIVVERPFIEPEEVREVIEGVLERRAGRLADRIKISVDVGEVTLNGTVQSDAEKRAVLGAVGHQRGVFSLRDHLAVQNHE